MHWLLTLAAFAQLGFSTDLIANESMRREALAAAFPGASISTSPAGRKLAPKQTPSASGVDVSDLVGFRDLFEKERVYAVVGAPTDDIERCAAEDIASRSISTARSLRFRLYALSQEDYVLISQYKFGLGNALACESIARVFHLQKSEGAWRATKSVTLPTQRHSSIQTIEFLPSTNRPRLLVESDVGGPGTVATSLSIFELSNVDLIEMLRITSRVAAAPDEREVFFQTIDLARTTEKEGRFCFAKTTLADASQWFQPPRITHPCYERDTGVKPR